MFISVVDTNTNKYLLAKKTFGSVNDVTIGREQNNFVLKYNLVAKVDIYLRIECILIIIFKSHQNLI